MMKKINPKTHDALFKWLITSFTKEFFAHYFPNIRIGDYNFIDKEFISKYKALKESLKGDLFLVIEVEIDTQLHEIVIQIEHMSKRMDVSLRVYEYLCYAWLLRKRPVWSIVIYTDDAIWRKPVPNSFWYAFDSSNQKQFHSFDVIKIRTEKSSELIKKHSLLCKLLSLKTDDRETNPEELVYKIYHATSERKESLNHEQLLLIEQWVNAYKKISDETFDKIKKEVNMEYIATTITEHIQQKSEIKGKIKMLEELFAKGVLPKKEFENIVKPLREELKAILSEQK